MRGGASFIIAAHFIAAGLKKIHFLMTIALINEFNLPCRDFKTVGALTG